MIADTWKYALKKTVRGGIESALSLESLLEWQRRRLSQKIVVLMYHEVAEDSVAIESWTVVRQSDFVFQMRYLRDHFRILSFPEALRLMESAETWKDPVVVVTFDDGYSGNRRVVLPIIEAMEIPITVFVATKAVTDGTVYWYDQVIEALQGEEVKSLDIRRFSLGTYRIKGDGVERWRGIWHVLEDLKRLVPGERQEAIETTLGNVGAAGRGLMNNHLKSVTLTDLKELAASPLVTIGAHSHCHNILTQLSEGEMRASVKQSKVLLESWIGHPVSCFAFPNGNSNNTVIDALNDFGFECAVTTNARVWGKSDSLYLIPRIGIGRYDLLNHFKIRVSGWVS